MGCAPFALHMSLLVFAFSFVPSIDTSHSFIADDSSAIASTCSKSPSRFFRKSEILQKSGSLPATSTRNGTSSYNRFWIFRELNTPAQSPYTSSLVIKLGSYGGCPRRSSPYAA